MPRSLVMNGGLTIGVEEEFFLVSTHDRHTAPIAPAVLSDSPLGPVEVKGEFTPAQVETATSVCTDLSALRRQLETGRAQVAELAAREGCLVIATGTPPLDEPAPPPLTDSPRYHWLAREYRSLAETQGVCGCHIHVGIPDLGIALQVSNHIRPWLAVLLALGANSPFCGGRDTGYASWRSVLWSRWPVSGIPPWWESVGHHEDLLTTLIGTGLLADERMAYWLARPSPRVPTIEIRVTDVQPTAEETVVLAGLVRGLVITALAEIEHGRPALPVSDPLGRAACWRAARDGLTGYGLDLRRGNLAWAWDLVGALTDSIRPALESTGDWRLVSNGLTRMRRQGNGSNRQLEVFHRTGNLHDVVDFLAASFSPGSFDVGETLSRRNAVTCPAGFAEGPADTEQFGLSRRPVSRTALGST